MKLYRYIPAVDRHNEKELYSGTLENLKNARLRLAHPASFNDPLEAIIPYRFVECGKAITPNQDELKELIASVSNIVDWTSPRGKRILEGLPFGITLENALILSLSRAENHQLMWAHYADNHRGICLEFDFSPAHFDEVKWSKCVEHYMKTRGLLSAYGNVNYNGNRRPITFKDGIAQNDYDIKDALLSKPECWKYEQEFRAFLLYPIGSAYGFSAGMDTKEFYFEYPKNWLSSITFGMRLSDDFRKQIIDCVQTAGYQNISWREEKLANDKFEITSETIDIHESGLEL